MDDLFTLIGVASGIPIGMWLGHLYLEWEDQQRRFYKPDRMPRRPIVSEPRIIADSSLWTGR
jgi:hypothetical protein